MRHKFFPILFGLAILSLSFGLASYYVEQQFDLFTIICVVSGGIALVVYFSFKPKQSSHLLGTVQWKKYAIILSVVLFCIFFMGTTNYLAYQQSYRWDLTQNNQHSLSANTLKFVRILNRPVQLTAFYVGLPPQYLQDLFKEYERVSNGLISTEIIDPIEQIGYAAKFGNVINNQERKVIVQSGNNRKDVDFTTSFLSENSLTNAIARVTQATRQVYFVTGHGEYSLNSEKNQGLSIFAKLLADNNISSKELMLGITQNIPDDCDVLIITGPHNDFTEKETKIISDYLYKGGDALFLIEHSLVTSPDKPLTAEQKNRNPSLNNILNLWGINIQQDVVIDLSSNMGDLGSPATKNYGNHKALTADLDYTFYVRPRSIRVLEDRRPTIKLAPIVLTASTENSWAETNRTLDIEYDPKIDTPGPVVISYVIFEEKEQDESSDTRIIVFTDADFLTNVYINRNSNAQMGLNIVNWLAELDPISFLDQKHIKVERLDLNSKQIRQVVAILFFIPFLLVIIGIMVWLRSKN